MKGAASAWALPWDGVASAWHSSKTALDPAAEIQGRLRAVGCFVLPQAPPKTLACASDDCLLGGAQQEGVWTGRRTELTADASECAAARQEPCWGSIGDVSVGRDRRREGEMEPRLFDLLA